MHTLKSVGVVVVVSGLFTACSSPTLVGGSEVGTYQLLPISQSEGVRQISILSRIGGDSGLGQLNGRCRSGD